MAESERDYIRDKTLEGQETTRKNGKAIGGVKVSDEDLLATALRLREEELSLREIAARLVIRTGKKRGHHPAPATVMRMLREHERSNGAESGPSIRKLLSGYLSVGSPLVNGTSAVSSA